MPESFLFEFNEQGIHPCAVCLSQFGVHLTFSYLHDRMFADHSLNTGLASHCTFATSRCMLSKVVLQNIIFLWRNPCKATRAAVLAWDFRIQIPGRLKRET
jgi:hypothetical protein